ncbi:MAG: hypothetical protein AB7O44_29925 [Hyphomicrobiaceae bacterium]
MPPEWFNADQGAQWHHALKNALLSVPLVNSLVISYIAIAFLLLAGGAANDVGLHEGAVGDEVTAVDGIEFQGLDLAQRDEGLPGFGLKSAMFISVSIIVLSALTIRCAIALKPSVISRSVRVSDTSLFSVADPSGLRRCSIALFGGGRLFLSSAPEDQWQRANRSESSMKGLPSRRLRALPDGFEGDRLPTISQGRALSGDTATSELNECS